MGGHPQVAGGWVTPRWKACWVNFITRPSWWPPHAPTTPQGRFYRKTEHILGSIGGRWLMDLDGVTLGGSKILRPPNFRPHPRMGVNTLLGITPRPLVLWRRVTPHIVAPDPARPKKSRPPRHEGVQRLYWHCK